MQFQNSLIVAAVLMVGIVSGRTIDDLTLEDTSELERIVGGRDAAPGQFPWAVVLFLDNEFHCTASILSNRTVMTAAHCVENSDGQQADHNRLHAIANVNRKASEQRIEFSAVFVHPDYDSQNIDNDIAILHTREPIQFNEEIGPVCIARSDTDPMEYKNATAMGWGSTSPILFLPRYPDNLKYAEQDVRDCGPNVRKEKICAKGSFEGICSGDSGGPLVHLSAIQPPVQIGIASYVNIVVGCTTLGPAYWTRVSSYNSFITENSDEGLCSI